MNYFDDDHNFIKVTVNFRSPISYASYHNHIPVVSSFTIDNHTDEPKVQIQVIFSASALLHDFILRLDKLEAQESRRFGAIDLPFSHEYLSRLGETENIDLTVAVTTSGEEVTKESFSIELLAYDQWAGIRELPELLAAFSTPNYPAIDIVLSHAGELLATNGGSRMLTGYQTGSREDVWYQIWAIYSVIMGEQLVYSAPPASFGTDGQKIRLADRIFSKKVATCLDLTMLFASCLEQVGLHPIVLIKKGHSWIGCWLVESASLPTVVIDDSQSIRKRVQSGEILVFETTGVAHHQRLNFTTAMDFGNGYLQNDQDFLFAIDIRRARMEQVLPLPSRWEVQEARESSFSYEPHLEAAPDLPPFVDQGGDFSTDIKEESGPEVRLRRWKGKLLDLSARNHLLNFKVTRFVVPLIVPNVGDVEDALADGKMWKFRALSELIPADDPRSVTIATSRTGVNPYENLAIKAMEQRELLSSLSLQELSTRLVNIFRASRTGFEEGGANTLFLSVGMLRWTDGHSERTAPILLIPVTLTRSSARSGMRMTRHDDETVVNPTLLQLLHQRFQLTLNGLDPLPLDKHGVDVAKILQIFRLAITDIPHWEVREDVYLGILSHVKYLMWKDLEDRTEDLRSNPVVSRLIDETPVQSVGEEFRQRQDIDKRHAPWELMTPLDADSSQLNAISRAAQGYDLVLEGPPGTGKSQTIANLIAHFLGSGRRVLFVSEKMAALDVVYQRLAKIGLAPFCLELHSAKAKKTEVLEQLRSALNVSASYSEEERMDYARQLNDLRTNLNLWLEVLHKPHANGLTVREAIEILSRNPDVQSARMFWEHPDVHSREDLHSQRELVRTASAVLKDLGSLHGHPLSGLHWSEWTNTWEDQVLDAIRRTERAAQNLVADGNQLAQLFMLPLVASTDQSLRDLNALAEILLDAEKIPAEVMRHVHEDVAPQLRDWRRHGKQYAMAWSALQTWFRPDVSQVDGKVLRSLWQSVQGKSTLSRWLGRRKILSQFRPFMVKTVPEHLLDGVLASLCQLNEEESFLKAIDNQASDLLGSLYQGTQTDWRSVARVEKWISEFETVARQLSRNWDKDTLDRPSPGLVDWMRNEGKESVMATLPRLKGYREHWSEYREVRMTLVGLTQELGQDHVPSDLDELLPTMERWLSARRQWRVWCRWTQLRDQLTRLALGSLIEQLEDGKVSPIELEHHWEYSYCQWWFRSIVDHEPLLRNFSHADYARQIADFQTADNQFRDLTARYIVSKLAAQVPKGIGVTQTATEMRVLQRELNKKRAHWPVRKLVRELPTLLPKLKPCQLMSPLSVAQYLDAKAKFDVVIFDEASQVPVWDAVGAIARGKQLVVVGDPKQLPPTSFFDIQDNEDEIPDDNTVQDLESILDECLGSSLPTLQLEWHYRSRHESLIAFSNHRYYGSQLVTFPSPAVNDVAVTLHLLEGIYDRGKTRTNVQEAKAVVEAIAQHFEHYGDDAPTLGVVTFNLPQQHLIEELLDQKLEAESILEECINKASERLFVKNLENVQGDERDIIFFSVTYGRDPTGRVALNMGPLNKDGGHRRLNVAITRARLGITIFSTITSEDIDLSRTRARGVVDLKEYLYYAKSGTNTREQSSLGSSAQKFSIEGNIATKLEQRGWKCRLQIGSSDHRVDIGVVDPNNSSRFIMGIESDGVNYQALPSARDRHRLHQDVLKGLGWNLERVWSLDWFTDPDHEVERIEQQLTELVQANSSESASPHIDHDDVQ